MYTWEGMLSYRSLSIVGRQVDPKIRKNFERHFQESRHAFGMRALGLPNTKHFHEITRIEDALACTWSSLSLSLR